MNSHAPGTTAALAETMQRYPEDLQQPFAVFSDLPWQPCNIRQVRLLTATPEND